jgi:hypothetical protein
MRPFNDSPYFDCRRWRWRSGIRNASGQDLGKRGTARITLVDTNLTHMLMVEQGITACNHRAVDGELPRNFHGYFGFIDTEADG